MQAFLSCILMMMMSGCGSCIKPLHKTSEKEFKATPLPFVIDHETIQKRAPNFSYQSDLVISVGHGQNVQENKETVTITSIKPYLLMTKKIDEFHFFELFRDQDRVFVKNLHGPWRKGGSDPTYYRELFADGMNLSAWLIEQFDLPSLWREEHRDGENIYVIDGKVLIDRAPFIKALVNKHPQFATIETSSLVGKLVFDSNTGLPLQGNLHIVVTGQEAYSLEIKANLGLSLTTALTRLEVPHVEEEEPVAAPVNVAPRFLDIVKDKRGES